MIIWLLGKQNKMVTYFGVPGINCPMTDIRYFRGKQKSKDVFISPQLSINISQWKFYFISNWKFSMPLFWINLTKWIVMKQQGIMSKGKNYIHTYIYFIFNKLPQSPIYAEFFFFLFTLFFSVVTYLLRIHTFVRVFWRTSLVPQNPCAMQETWIQFLGW